MNFFIRTQGKLLLCAALMTSGAAFASPIIVNLDATSATASSVTESLSAGTYTVTIVGTNVSGALYNGWNTSQPAATDNDWTDRYAIDVCGGTCNDELAINNNPEYSNVATALAAYQSAATLSLQNLTTGTFTTGVANPYTFTLTSAQKVIFSIPDYGSNWDDTGGESLQLAQVTTGATPEPSTFLLFGAALVPTLLFRQRIFGKV